MTDQQKMEILKELLNSLKHWRGFYENANGKVIPESILEALRILFPKGV